MSKKIKIMLVEDNLEFRDVVALALEVSPDFTLTGQYGTAEVALRNLQNGSVADIPDLVLLDLNLPGMSGTEAIPWFKKYAPTTQIMVLTQSNREADILAAVNAGASGYLLKSSTLSTLKESIRDVINGGSTLDPGVARFILNSLKTTQVQSNDEHNLTARELEILLLISEGLAQKEVADRLCISPKTVCIHTGHIYEKLQVPNAPAAISKAYKSGIL